MIRPWTAWRLSFGFSLAVALGCLCAPAAALAGPSLELTLDPPRLVLEPCTTTTLTAQIRNDGYTGTGSDDLRFVALMAVVTDDTLMEFVQPAEANAVVRNASGVITWAGTVYGTPRRLWYQAFGSECGGFEYRLPPDVVLRMGDTLTLALRVHCLGEGDVTVHLFAPASEDHPAQPPALLSGVADRTNLYYLSGGKKVIRGWYPLHNALDTRDTAWPTGHSFMQHSWTPKPLENAYAKADVLIEQRTTWHTYESSCFSEQHLAIPLDMSFAIGHKLKVSIGDTTLDLGCTALPGESYTGSVPLRIWSNDDVECRLDCSPMVGAATGATITIEPELKVDGASVHVGVWQPITGPEGVTGEQGLGGVVSLTVPASYGWRPDTYTGAVVIEVRQF